MIPGGNDSAPRGFVGTYIWEENQTRENYYQCKYKSIVAGKHNVPEESQKTIAENDIT